MDIPVGTQAFSIKEDYKKQIDQIIMLLEGKTESIVKQIKQEMKDASDKQDYETAARLRDRASAIERFSQEQKVSNINEKAIDVIGVYKNEIDCVVEIFFVRNSKMIGREHYFLDNMQGEETKTILSDFVKQYYMNKLEFPSKIMLQEEIEDSEILEKLFTDKAGKKVEFKTPQKGEKLRFVEMCVNNAKITLENKTKEKQDMVLGLKKALKIEKLPRKIECFDISNLSGDYMVAGMCVAIDGVIKRNLSRRFKIKTVFTQDDPRCTEEVVTRRLKHSIDNPKGGFGNLPDVIFADGGITQIRAIKKAIQKYNLEIPVFGMVKNDKHQTKNLIDENRQVINLSEEQLNFVTRMQDEVHNVAIEYNRKLREQEATKSKLDDIPGVGEKKKQELLKHFGSVENIKKADIEELTKIKGINPDLARNIKEFLD